VRRLSVRWKVTLAFALALVAVLGGLGAFVYLRFDSELSEALDRGLRSRADQVASLVERSGSAQLAQTRALSLESDESFAQVLAADGTVLEATPRARAELLPVGQVRTAARERVFVDRPGDERFDEAVRMLALPVRAAGGEQRIVVVGASLDEKEEALSTLLLLLVLGLSGALLGASVAGWAVAGLALRPIRESIAKERRFVADASHELRTPLTVLKSEIEVALLERRDAASLEAALESAGEETDRLIRLAEDLLVLAQADEGRLPIRREPVAVREVAAEVAAPGVVVDVPAGLTVSADRDRLRQVLLNLLDNARRHGAGAVELSGSLDGASVRIGVRDHGPGFPPGYAERAFERFSRPDAGRSGEGAGLGLAIVAAVVSAHGGSVRAENTSPGARVEIVLPARA
jgi:signal transduction histidine kinase